MMGLPLPVAEAAGLAVDETPYQPLSHLPGANCDALASYLRVFAEVQRLEQTGADCYAEACAWFAAQRREEMQKAQEGE